ADTSGRAMPITFPHIVRAPRHEPPAHAGCRSAGRKQAQRCGRMVSTSPCGRGITCTDTSSPTRPAAAAPASVAALTAPTSPRTMTVTYAAPVCTLPFSVTLAALTMASAASMAPTGPRVSTIPRAIIWTSGIAVLLRWVPDWLVTAVVLSDLGSSAGAGSGAACAAGVFLGLALRGGAACPASFLGSGSCVIRSLLHLLENHLDESLDRRDIQGSRGCARGRRRLGSPPVRQGRPGVGPSC